MELWFYFLLGLVAFLYASVGHGGASGYLALMALMGVDLLLMRSTALTLNLFVASASFYNFYRAGFFRWQLIYPFLITSIPASYIGAYMRIGPASYKIILGVFLVIATARILYKPERAQRIMPFSLVMALVIGAVLGLFSGMIGIGGGIILTPILVLLGWASVKEAAAASAIFIFLNSAAGLVGIFSRGYHVVDSFWIWIIVGVIGGFAGAYWGSHRLSFNGLKYVLAGIMILAGAKLFMF